MSTAVAPGARPLTVKSAVVAPRARAAAKAWFVAHVPPSWLTPMHSPPAGSSDASNAWTATGPGLGRPAVRHASPRISTAPRAPCSLVPQPTIRTGTPRSAASRRAPARRAAEPSAARRARQRSAKAGSARIISVMNHGGPPRSTGCSAQCHGSGGPGRGRSGSNPETGGSLMAPMIGWPHHRPGAGPSSATGRTRQGRTDPTNRADPAGPGDPRPAPTSTRRR